MSRSCHVSVFNNSPYKLYIKDQVMYYGEWEIYPPSFIDSMSDAQFIANPKGSDINAYNGTKFLLEYLVEDSEGSSFLVECDNPKIGQARAIISNPNPFAFFTFFYCITIPPDLGRATIFKFQDFNRCSTTKGDVILSYHINFVKSVVPISIEQLHLASTGSTYIKITNNSPYNIIKLSSKIELGYWEKQLEDKILPFSSTSYGQVASDRVEGKVSKGSVSFILDEESGLKTFDIIFFNPDEGSCDKQCRSYNPEEKCCDVEANMAAISNLQVNTISTFYRCSTDDKVWLYNYCAPAGDILYLDFNFWSIS